MIKILDINIILGTSQIVLTQRFETGREGLKLFKGSWGIQNQSQTLPAIVWLWSFNSVLFQILLVISNIYVVVCSYWIISSGNGDMKSRVGCVSNNATINVMLRHDSTRNVLYLLSIRNDLLKKWYFRAFQIILIQSNIGCQLWVRPPTRNIIKVIQSRAKKSFIEKLYISKILCVGITHCSKLLLLIQ